MTDGKGETWSFVGRLVLSSEEAALVCGWQTVLHDVGLHKESSRAVECYRHVKTIREVMSVSSRHLRRLPLSHCELPVDACRSPARVHASANTEIADARRWLYTTRQM